MRARDLGLAQGRLPWGVWKKGFQVVHGGDEVGFLHGHGELDRIEVRLTREAAAQVGAGIDRGELFLATGAEERQLSLAELMRPIELLQ